MKNITVSVYLKMAPVTNVVVLTTHGRRLNIKVQPNTTLMKVLEEVCNKYEFAIEDHDLKHHNKVLDLSMLMRYSGLPNNATLEMCVATKKRTESSVIVLVQLEDGTRLTDSFTPSDSLWQVISGMCSKEVSAMTNPVIIYTRTEVSGEENMSNTTLRSLGLTGGRAMFRLLNRTEEQLHTQANVSAPLQRPVPPPPPPKTPPPQVEASPSPSVPVAGPSWAEAGPSTAGPSFAGPSSAGQSVPYDVSPPRKTKRQETRSEEDEKRDKEAEKHLKLVGERSAVVFNRLAGNPQQMDDLPADFFELTLEDAKRLLRDLRKQREQLENQQLKTAALRELEENTSKLALLQKYRHTVLRVYFPDGTVLQGAFKPVESGDAVYTFVRAYLQQPDQAFQLYTTPPKRVLESEDRLIEVGCVPGAVLHFNADPLVATPTFLKQELLDQLSSPEAALLAARRCKTT